MNLTSMLASAAGGSGHLNPVKLFLDADLQRFQRIWAAAGTPFSVFPLTPAELSLLTGAEWSDIRLER